MCPVSPGRLVIHVEMIARHGNTLVIVLGLALLLAVQITIVNTLSMGGFRHLNKVNAHVRAITVGESAFARILARIKGAAWEARWFAAANCGSSR